MAFLVSGALETLSLPSAYSFCASMMMRVLSLGEAVEPGRPMIWRKDCADIAIELNRVLRQLDFVVSVLWEEESISYELEHPALPHHILRTMEGHLEPFVRRIGRKAYVGLHSEESHHDFNILTKFCMLIM